MEDMGKMGEMWTSFICLILPIPIQSAIASPSTSAHFANWELGIVIWMKWLILLNPTMLNPILPISGQSFVESNCFFPYNRFTWCDVVWERHLLIVGQFQWISLGIEWDKVAMANRVRICVPMEGIFTSSADPNPKIHNPTEYSSSATAQTSGEQFQWNT